MGGKDTSIGFVGDEEVQHFKKEAHKRFIRIILTKEGRLLSIFLATSVPYSTMHHFSSLKLSSCCSCNHSGWRRRCGRFWYGLLKWWDGEFGCDREESAEFNGGVINCACMVCWSRLC